MRFIGVVLGVGVGRFSWRRRKLIPSLGRGARQRPGSFLCFRYEVPCRQALETRVLRRAGAGWCIAGAVVSALQTATLGSLDPRPVAVLDLPLFVGASALAAAGVRWAAFTATGWTLLVAGGLTSWGTLTGEAGWGVVVERVMPQIPALRPVTRSIYKVTKQLSAEIPARAHTPQ
ncbi:hypothetical protein C5C18_01560 [Rathayibacter tritici]|nr:hypothetical protein C5C06_07590 [Rathayibacter tritici]PPG09095.1 hypothetical protein C5C18_01560 [Rathayibacter tritici]PPI47327.1 hypothetical protein C5D18_04025 [Rathayibacter tritici]